MTQATAEQTRIKSEYGRIVSEIQPLLIHRAMSLTRDRDYACDLVQATLERGFRSFDRFQSGTNAASWLFTIMTHHFIDEYRHAKLMRFGRSIDSLEIPVPRQTMSHPGPTSTSARSNAPPHVYRTTVACPSSCRSTRTCLTADRDPAPHPDEHRRQPHPSRAPAAAPLAADGEESN